jgi:hypothetical protein
VLGEKIKHALTQPQGLLGRLTAELSPTDTSAARAVAEELNGRDKIASHLDRIASEVGTGQEIDGAARERLLNLLSDISVRCSDLVQTTDGLASLRQTSGRLVLVENDVERPVQDIFDAPMFANDAQQFCGRVALGQKEVALDRLVPSTFAGDPRDGLETRKVVLFGHIPDRSNDRGSGFFAAMTGVLGTGLFGLVALCRRNGGLGCRSSSAPAGSGNRVRRSFLRFTIERSHPVRGPPPALHVGLRQRGIRLILRTRRVHLLK